MGASWLAIRLHKQASYIEGTELRPLPAPENPFLRIPSPDGAYVAVMGQGIREAATERLIAQQPAAAWPPGQPPVWAPDSRRLVYASGDLVSLPEGRIERLLDPAKSCMNYYLLTGFTPDGKRLYYSVPGCM